MSKKKINTLHPVVKAMALEHKRRCKEEGINILIYYGLRSMEEQAALYAQGRTKPGKVVTNAKPGKSWHNFALAYDVVEVVNKKCLWEGPNWSLIGKLGKEVGMAWGGDWKPTKSLPEGDRPHFEYHPDLNLDQANQRLNNGQELLPQVLPMETKVAPMVIKKDLPIQSLLVTLISLFKSFVRS